MTATMRLVGVAARTSARRALADRGGMLISATFYLVIVANLAGLWRVAARGNGGEIAGYSAAALSWYVAMSEVGTVAVSGRLIEDTGRAIGAGDIAVELLRPARPVIVRIASETGRTLIRMAVLAGCGLVLTALLVGAPPNLATLPVLAVSLVLAVAVNVTAMHLFAASAFWLRDAGMAWFLYQKFVLVTGGVLLPLEILPRWLRTVADVLPFRAIGYAPGRLAAGHFEPWLVAQQAAWVVVLVALTAVAFAGGESRLQVVGG